MQNTYKKSSTHNNFNDISFFWLVGISANIHFIPYKLTKDFCHSLKKILRYCDIPRLYANTELHIFYIIKYSKIFSVHQNTKYLYYINKIVCCFFLNTYALYNKYILLWILLYCIYILYRYYIYINVMWIVWSGIKIYIHSKKMASFIY